MLSDKHKEVCMLILENIIFLSICDCFLEIISLSIWVIYLDFIKGNISFLAFTPLCAFEMEY